MQTVERADPAQTILNSVNHDVEPCGNAALRSPRLVLIGRIGNVQGKMEAALRVATIDLVNSLRRLVISFLLLRPDRIPTERYAITFQFLSVGKDRQFSN